jgi:hypothetical protein
MIRRDDYRESAIRREHTEEALACAASGLMQSTQVHAPRCTAAIVIVGDSGEWRVLAKRGPADVSSARFREIACCVRDTDRPFEERDFIAPFAAVKMHAMLILAPHPGERLPTSVGEELQHLLHAGGVILDDASSGRSGALPVVDEALRDLELV